MVVSKEFLELLVDALRPLGPVQARRMFGGAGLSLGGTTFALVAFEAVWLKADPESAPAFAAEGSEPFGYETRTGRRVIASYWRAPDRLLDEPEELVAWARRALAVARRSGPPMSRRTRGKNALPGEGSGCRRSR